MKILVLSDSHSSLRFMCRCVEQVRPDAVVHLGDHYDDGEALAESYPQIPMHQVAGNCDRYRCPAHAREMLCYPVGGAMLFMTHGHQQRVKSGIGGLLAEARRYGAAAALYGHTHIPHEEYADGLYFFNPGSLGYGGTYGYVDVVGGGIRTAVVSL